MTLAPIALFAYNRPRHLIRVVEALALNPEAENSSLFVYSDAPRTSAEINDVAAVRAVARGIKGFLSVELIEQPTNKGVARSVIDGVGELVERFGRVIVLEDDLLPSIHFLRFMNDALARYEHDARIISIHAYSYPVDRRLPETFFLRGADCWGWATWKRGWNLFESDGRTLLQELEQRSLASDFDFNGSYPYTRMLQDCIAGKNDSWAILWHASAFLKEKLTLYPGSSQIQNIGIDGSGRHVGETSAFTHETWGNYTRIETIPVEESEDSRDAFGRFLRKVDHPSFVRKLISSLKRLIAA